MKAYEAGIKQFVKIHGRAVWLDIGTGAHMTLTRLLLKHGAVDHVYAVEANQVAFSFAKDLLKYFSNDSKSQITLYEGYSKQIDWYAQNPRPNAIIHEIVGCIATDEGCIKVMHDTVKNLHGDVRFCIPHLIGTLCIPVTRPQISIFSSICSLLLCSSATLLKTVGIQGIFHPPRDSLLCEKSQLVESFFLLEYARNAPEKRFKTKKTFIVEKKMSTWHGFYLAPYILTVDVDDKEAAEIDGLKYMTNWPIRYVQIYDDENGIAVRRGDEIHLVFESDLTSECPSYRLEAWLNDDYLQRSSFVWTGPAIS